MKTSLKTMSFMTTLSSRVKASGKKLSLGALSYRRIHLLIFVNQRSVKLRPRNSKDQERSPVKKFVFKEAPNMKLRI